MLTFSSLMHLDDIGTHGTANLTPLHSAVKGLFGSGGSRHLRPRSRLSRSLDTAGSCRPLLPVLPSRWNLASLLRGLAGRNLAHLFLNDRPAPVTSAGGQVRISVYGESFVVRTHELSGFNRSRSPPLAALAVSRHHGNRFAGEASSTRACSNRNHRPEEMMAPYKRTPVVGSFV